jgi:3-methyladenine DNA glycosylase/8-oxoguanine DNA glycosylase
VDTRTSWAAPVRAESNWVHTGRGRAARLRRKPGSGPVPPVPWIEPDATGEWRPSFPVDLLRTLAVHRRGPGDPAFRIIADGSMWRTALTPEGPGTIRVTTTRPAALDAATISAGPRQPPLRAVPPQPAAPLVPGAAHPRAGAAPPPIIRAAAWGPGASWLLRTLPAALGAGDDPAGFAPVHPVLHQLSRRLPGLRIGRTGLVMEALVPAVLEQKVSGVEAHRAWRRLMLKFGGPAPGPVPPGMRVFPPPQIWRRIPSWEWHRAGAEAVRARTIIGAAQVASRLEEIVSMPPAAADQRLQLLPGIGPWTSAEIRQRACGDPDAVSVGDLHLPGVVGWALIGQVVDDAGMLELLKPYAGHRHRAASLLVAGGFGPPRRAPRMPLRDYRAF